MRIVTAFLFAVFCLFPLRLCVKNASGEHMRRFFGRLTDRMEARYNPRIGNDDQTPYRFSLPEIMPCVIATVMESRGVLS
jgi:hypothetical protein